VARAVIIELTRCRRSVVPAHSSAPRRQHHGSLRAKLGRLQLTVLVRWRLARTSCPRPQFRILSLAGCCYRRL